MTTKRKDNVTVPREQTILDQHYKHCSVCDKGIFVNDDWVYKVVYRGNHKYQCSYSCHKVAKEKSGKRTYINTGATGNRSRG